MTESEAEAGTSNLNRKRYSSRSPRQTPEHKHSPKSSPKMAPKRIGQRMDGYEADTDDTLQRRSRRKSVKELAGMFQRAENACPSPLPFRPKQFDSDYDSDSRTTDSIVFNQSRAYIPPKWAPSETPVAAAESIFVQKVEKRSTEKVEKADETKILRLNQMSTDLTNTSTNFKESSSKFETSSTSSSMMTSTSASASFEASKSMKTTTTSFSKEISSSFKTSGVEIKNSPPVIFTPKKFVPKTSGEAPPAAGFEPGTDDSSKIKPKWSPSGSSKLADPTYRKIRPIFQSGKVPDSEGSLFKAAPSDVIAKVGDQVTVLFLGSFVKTTFKRTIEAELVEAIDIFVAEAR